ncbi:MAG: DUF5915 domain-containing protein [Thermoplasmata archaeon]
MSIEKVRIRSSLPFNLPFKGEDIYSLSFSDFILKLNEVLSSSIQLKYTPPGKITPDKIIIPVDTVVPIILKRPVVNFNEMSEYIKGFSNSIIISSADPNAIWSLDLIMERLFKTNSIFIKEKSTYYCEYCKTQLSNRDVHVKKGEYKQLYAKIRISENTYFIHSGIEDVVFQLDGVNIDPEAIFVIQNLGNERWIMQNDIFKKLKEKTLIFPSREEERKGKDLADEFKYVKTTFIKGKKTKFLSSEFSEEDARLIGKGERINVEIIDHDILEGELPYCNYCGRRVTRKRLKGAYIKLENLNFNIYPKNFINVSGKEILISKDFKNFPKIPLLECDRCGRIEYGQAEKPCSCGGMMKRNYSYDPAVLPVGVYSMVQSIKNRGVLNHREFKHRFLMLALISEIKSNYFSDIFISYTDLKEFEKYKDEDREILRLSFIGKMHGKFHENDLRRYSKLKNMMVNILNYADIYGLRDNETIIDMWISSKIEKLKIDMEKFLENYKFKKLLNEYENLLGEISRVYMQLNRKGKINSRIFNEILIISYPFFPFTILSFSIKNQINLNDFKVGKFSINETLEKLVNDLKYARKMIINYRIKNGIKTSIPIKKLVIEVDFKNIPLLLNIKQNLMRYFNAYSIEITDKWRGLEYRVKLKRENLGEIYKPLAHVIESVISKIDAKKFKEEIEKNNYEIGIEGNLITITPQMVEFRYELPKNYEMIELPYVKIFFDNGIDDELQDYMVVKKLSRRISFMRKKASVEYDDYIDLSLSDSKLLKNILKPYTNKLMDELRIRKINFSDRIKEMLVMSFSDILEGEIEVGISPVYKKYKIKAISKLPGLSPEDAEKIYSAGFNTINDLYSVHIKEITDKTGLPLQKVKNVKDYLDKYKSFDVLIVKEKYYCPMCESELTEKFDNCPRCGVKLEWPRDHT